ncbi:MAG: methyltransferase domain-containing protein [Oculatellaceae cyanobacterium bins.114]|nr:methyltransferase domain-containing protein [Oculatellaceae cyanobacterium bins.114]
MDYDRFMHELPHQYENWGTPSVRLISDQFQAILKQTRGKTTARVLQLLNSAAHALEANELICFIGSQQASHLIGTLLNNPTLHIIYNATPTDIDTPEDDCETLASTLAQFGVEDQVFLYRQDFEDFLLELRTLKLQEKVGILFYDGLHDYRSHLMALLLAKSVLADRALLIISGNHLRTTHQASQDFIASHPECQLLLDLSSGTEDYKWDNIQILSWNCDPKVSLEEGQTEFIRNSTAIKILSEITVQFDEDALQAQQIAERNETVITALLKSKEPIQLELGAGGRTLKGWTSIDVGGNSDLSLDLTQPLPFPDHAVSQIYSSHVLEHFYYPYQLGYLLAESYRILKPDGWFRAAVPDASIYLNGYFKPDQFDSDQYCVFKPAFHYNSPIDHINYIAYMAGQHCHLFDPENLVAIIQKAGFREVKLREFDPSIDLEERHYESIYVEGVK